MEAARRHRDDHSRRPHRMRKRACIPASTNAILYTVCLKEVVPTTSMDDGCAICLKALAAGQVVHDMDATADDELKSLIWLL